MHLSCTWFRQLAQVFCISLLAASIAHGQDYQLQPGTPPFTTYQPVELGFINLANGNLHLEIPMGSFPQRGGRAFAASLVYDSRIWWTGPPGTDLWAPSNLYQGWQSTWGGWRFLTNAYIAAGNAHYTYTPIGCGLPYHGSRYQYSNFYMILADGSQKNFPGITTLSVDSNCAKDGWKAVPSGGAYASDGSGYYLAVTNYNVGTIYAPDGTSADDANGNGYGIDANGNYIDTAGREPVVVTTNCNGNGSQTCYDVMNSQGTTSRYTVTTTSIPVSTAFGWSGYKESSTSITVIQSILLPDQTSYQFSYDSGTAPGHYGELTGLTLPTGGQIAYGYTNFADARGGAYVNRWVTSRTSGGGTWTYTPQVITQGTSQQVTVARPNGDNVLYTFAISGSITALTQVQAYNGAVSPPNLAATDAITWYQGDIQKLSETLTLPTTGGLSVSQTKQYTYDSIHDQNVSQLSEWKYYTGSLPSTADRVTSATYTLANSTYAAAHIINKPTSVTVKSGGGTQLAQNNYTYDSTALISVTGTPQHDDVNFGTGKTIRGNLTQIQAWNGGSNYLGTTKTYDTTGQARSIQDPAQNTTLLSYSDNFFTDASGTVTPPTFTAPTPTNAYLTQVTLPITGSLIYGYYYGTGKTALSKDQNGADSYAHFLDALDRLTLSYGPSLTNGKRPWSLATYSASETQVDNYVAISDATASTGCSSCIHNQVVLDGLGRTITKELVSDPDGPTFVNTAYDVNGRVQSTSHPYRSTGDSTYGLETPTYDALGRIVKMTHQDGTYAQIFYGASVAGAGLGGVTSQLCSTTTYGIGYPALEIDEAGKKLETWTDGFGKVIEVDEPDSNGNLTSATCYNYDLLGNLLQSVHGSQTRSFTYDALSRLTSSTVPERAAGTSGTTNFYYTTSSGALCSWDSKEVCRQTDPRGITTTFSYDALGRLTGKSYSDTTPAVTYSTDQTNCGSGALSNGLGRITGTQVSDGSSSELLCYDAAGHLITDKQTIAGISKTISYVFNSDDSLASITYPSGRTITYNVGNAGRSLSAIDTVNNINYATSATYASPGGLASIVFGGTSPSNGIPEQFSYNNRLQLSSLVDGPSTTSYSYNLNGTLKSFTNSQNSGLGESFNYDPLDRILSAATQASSGPGCWGQTFGSNGVADDTYNNLNQISVSQCSAGSLSVGVDANNHIITAGYGYDGTGNMIQDGSGIAYSYDAENRITSANGVSYSYDGNGLRVRKSSGTLYWRSSAGDALSESDLSGNITNEYVFFEGRRTARRDASGNVFYYFLDDLGTVTGVTDAGGNPCYEASFTPYGQESPILNSCPPSYKFTGFERDPETGLDYAFARYYNSRTGRFMSVDPTPGDIYDPQTLNRYAYVRNDPANRTDPSGLCDGVACLGPSNPHDPGSFQCSVDGAITGCGMAFGLVGVGAAASCPDDDCTGWKLLNVSGDSGTFIRDPIGLALDASTIAASCSFFGASGTCVMSFVHGPITVATPPSDLGMKALAGTSNFFAGAGDCLTGRCIPFVNASLTQWARSLNGADAVVNKTSLSYAGGEFTGGVVGSALLSAGGATLAAIADGKNGAYFGRAINNPLFNGNALGTGRLRFGWNWIGRADTGRNIIRLGIGAARGKKWWSHIVFWSRWI